MIAYGHSLSLDHRHRTGVSLVLFKERNERNSATPVMLGARHLCAICSSTSWVVAVEAEKESSSLLHNPEVLNPKL